MSAPHPRRAILRGIAALPFIGGVAAARSIACDPLLVEISACRARYMDLNYGEAGKALDEDAFGDAVSDLDDRVFSLASTVPTTPKGAAEMLRLVIENDRPFLDDTELAAMESTIAFLKGLSV